MITTHHAKSVFQTGSYGERLRVTHRVILCLDEWLPWLAARQFTGLTFTRSEDGWLIVLKAIRKKKPQVAFFAGINPEDAAAVMVHALLFDLATWKADKWATMRNDKT